MTANEPQTRKHQCWISSYLDYTENLPSPERFRKWAAISAVVGALERRAYIKTGAGELYPNMFILLVAPPGVGKDFAMNPAKELWVMTNKLNIAPNSMTHKGLVDHMADSGVNQSYVDDKGHFVNYHSILVSVGELGVFLPSHDLAFLSTLNDLYNCGKIYEERSRMGKETLKIENPHIHILSGTQPKFIGTIFPEEAYGMGFTSRIIMVYWGLPTKQGLFTENKFNNKLRDSLAKDLRQITELKGEFYIEDDAKAAIEQWHAQGSEEDKPTHTKLLHYNARRIMHILKLAMAYSVSRSNAMIISLADFEKAKDTLLDVERDMPEIFKEISSGGNSTEIEEGFHFVMRLYTKNKKPVPEHKLVHFLASKVPVNQISFLIDTMIRSAMLEVAPHPSGLNLPNQERYFQPRALNASEDY